MSIPFSYQSSSPFDHNKKTVAIPTLDSLIIQMQDRFLTKIATPAICFVSCHRFWKKALQLYDEVEGMLFWEKDNPFPKSLGNEVPRWKTLWQSTDCKLPNNLLLARLLVIACTLLITSAEAERSFWLMKWITPDQLSSKSKHFQSSFSIFNRLS